MKIKKVQNYQILSNLQFLTFATFVAEISNKQRYIFSVIMIFYKLDEILGSFPSRQFFVIVTVFKVCEFEISNSKQWSRGVPDIVKSAAGYYLKIIILNNRNI